MAETKLDILDEYFNKKIPEDEYIFRRVSLNTLLNSDPVHKLVIVKGFFKNEDGTGMSVDWERLCADPRVIQTRNGRCEADFGVIVISCFDLKNLKDRILRIMNDQIEYKCHCSIKGIPMSLRDLKIKKREIFNNLSITVRTNIKTALFMIREFLIDHAYWVIPFNTDDLNNPPEGFNYSDSFTEKIRDFFISRGYQIPS